VLEPDRGDEHHRPFRKARTHPFACPARRPGNLYPAPPLVVDDEEGAVLLDDGKVELHQRGMTHIRDEARMRLDRLHHLVPLDDDPGQHIPPPVDPGMPGGIVETVVARQLEPGRRLEAPRAVGAIAYAVPL